MQRAIPLEEREFIYFLRKLYRFARALEVLRGRPLYTREFLGIMRSWGDSHELLKELELLGLVERYVDYCRSSRRKCVYNRLSKRGAELLELLERIITMIK